MNKLLKLLNYSKAKEAFGKLSLRRKYLAQVALLVFFIAATGVMAFRGVHKVYQFSGPLAETSYPLAAAVVNALHSMEVYRALAIQYALEQDTAKLSFLKKRFDSEFQRSQELLNKITTLPYVPKELDQHWQVIQKTQKMFQETGQAVIQTHDEQLALAKTRNDQTHEANVAVKQMMEILGGIAENYVRNNDIQFLTIAAQVILLEQRYLYEPELSSPLSLASEKTKEEENRIFKNKEAFQSYIDKFQKNQRRLESLIPKHVTKYHFLLDSLGKLYKNFIERAQGDEGIFLIQEDEIGKLSRIEMQLNQLEKAYGEGSQSSLSIQKVVSEQMQKASSVILSLKSSSYFIIFGVTLFFSAAGIFLGLFITNNVVKPIEDLTRAAKEIGQGHWDQRVGVTSQDEVGQLALTFNEMADQVHGLNQSLEKRVAERTQQLGEANIRLTKASEMKSEFLSTISHDLKTPLSSILGFTQIILSDTQHSLYEQHTKNLNTILKSAKELLQMIDLILDFSKMEAGKMGMVVGVEEFSFETLVDECLESTEFLIRNKPVELLKEVQTHLPRFQTDRLKVKRILLNLLFNAAKFTEKGKIEVSAHKKDEHFIQFSVQDTGYGIPSERLPTLFEGFKLKEHEVNPEEGGGLGLSIAKKLVTLLGGTIHVKSEIGKGTTFNVSIPLVYPKKEALQKKEAA